MKFDAIFFTFLEYEITKFFKVCKVAELSGFWCDGVMPSAKTSMIDIIKTSQLTLKTFIGKSGQEEYDLVLKFGQRSLSCINAEYDIKMYFPSIENDDAFIIDLKRKIFELEFQ